MEEGEGSQEAESSVPPIVTPHTHQVAKVISTHKFRSRTYHRGCVRARSYPIGREIQHVQLQDLTIIPVCPRDGTLEPMEMCTMYNPFCHQDAVWLDVDGDSAFKLKVPTDRLLSDFISNAQESMKEKSLVHTEVNDLSPK